MFRRKHPPGRWSDAAIRRDAKISDPKIAELARSQHGEDRFILGLAEPQDIPYLVDVGANDGYSWSNSWLFIHLGCQALLIEPMPAYAAQCRQHYARNNAVKVVEAAISESAGKASFFVNKDKSSDLLAMRSSLLRESVPGGQVGEITVRTAPLGALLERNGCPQDYFLLSIDAEGMDLMVLKTAQLGRFRPRIACIEEEMFGPLIPDFMAHQGYERLAVLGPNGIYRRLQR